MKRILIRSCVTLSLVLLGAAFSFAQSAENGSSNLGKADPSDSPRGMKDQLVKMQIEREKKN
jgi:hypothetical protein